MPLALSLRRSHRRDRRICFLHPADTGKQRRRTHNANIGSNQRIDDEGVAMLLAPAPGSRFHLGKDNPNGARNFQIERKTPALPRTDGALQYWNVAAHDLDYASGGSGKTSRLHIYASGGQQSYTWKTQQGFLSSSADIRNQEFTAFVRVHGITDPKRAAITLKIRGGAHGAINPDLASCTMMTFQAVEHRSSHALRQRAHPPDLRLREIDAGL